MASHQQRREPLPADYQFPTHGVECDCPPCRSKTVTRADILLGVAGAVEASRRKGALLEPTADTPWAV